jgi:hypothetical protein
VAVALYALDFPDGFMSPVDGEGVIRSPQAPLVKVAARMLSALHSKCDQLSLAIAAEKQAA